MRRPTRALIGLFPVLGDVVGVFLSTYILKEAAALGVPRSILVRIGFIVARWIGGLF